MASIGIDLGTTNCCIYTIKNGKPQIVVNDQGQRTTPSFVAFREDKLLVGQAAVDQILSNPTNTVHDVKRIIGRKFSDPKVQSNRKMWAFHIDQENDQPIISVQYHGQENRFSPEEITAFLLNYLRKQAEVRLGEMISHAVITVPAYFQQSQKESTMLAANLIGLKVAQLINEPTAAAIAYTQKQKLKQPRTFLVYDLGGGTFDAAVVQIKDQNTGDVLCVSGDPHLGGEDFVRNMITHFKRELQDRYNLLFDDETWLHELRIVCQTIKHHLSFATPVKCGLYVKGTAYELEMNRETFVNLNDHLFRQTVKVVEKMLEARSMKKQDIDEILLIGGSTRIPRIQELLLECFKHIKKLTKSINPDEAVAMGAAIVAARPKCVDYKNVASGSAAAEPTQDLVVRDALPHSLGLREKDDRMRIFLRASTLFPVTHEEIATTTEDNQRSMKVSVYQGESRDTKENTFLGEFVLKGIPPKPKHSINVKIRFNVDENGILTVTGEHSEQSNDQVQGELQVDILHKQSSTQIDQMKKHVQETLSEPKLAQKHSG
ncbi:Heat shock protein 70 [Fasciolopsis buskii]|uniref:Heat shock protein 70 n=1 Tax=Fasciolopsis buskii TaxID=27845 RepID=A0A8E0S5Y7_9TREM|nr:Heat shock protein 70 [Fasciolopsis buski]